MKREAYMEAVENRIGGNLEQYIKNLYVTKGKTLSYVAENLGITQITARRWLEHFEIKIKNTSEAKLAKVGVSKPSREKLEQLYIKERKSIRQIADALNISSSPIVRWLKEYGISTRTIQQAHWSDKVSPLTKEELKKLYVDEKKSCLEIAKVVGVNHVTIINWLKKYGIERRNKDGIYNNKQYRKQICDKLIDIIGKKPEELTTTDFKTKLTDADNTLGGLLSWYCRTYECNPAEARNKLVNDLYGVHIKRKYNTNTEERKIRGHWRNWNTLETELNSITSKLGHFPTAKQLQKIKCGSSLIKAIQYFGGFDKVKVRLGYEDKKIKSKEQFLTFLTKYKAAKCLATLAINLQGQSVDIEHIIAELYDGRFKDEEQLHSLLEESAGDISKLIEDGVINLGSYLGNFSLDDRRILPILLGGALTYIPDEKITQTLEERLIKILRTVYSPRFNEDPNAVLSEIGNKVGILTGKKRELYQRLIRHYKRIIELKEELV